MEKRSIPNELLLPAVEEMLAEGHEVELMTKGSSMLPFIRGDHDSVLLRKAEPKVGDIALARVEGERYVLHRVIAVDGDKVTLMGDGNLRGQEHCLKPAVAGIVLEILKPGGRRVVPGDGHVWRRLMPLRRIILGVYRRLLLIWK